MNRLNEYLTSDGEIAFDDVEVEDILYFQTQVMNSPNDEKLWKQYTMLKDCFLIAKLCEIE